jgi:RND family efflux transporter MFP subunit
VARQRVNEIGRGVGVAQTRLRDAVVTAPFEGTITRIVTQTGGITGPGAPIVQLVRTSAPEIRLDVDEAYLGRITIGQEATISSRAFAGETFSATVREIGAEVDNARGTVELRLSPKDPPKWIRPGQTVDVNIVVDKGTPRLIVPLTALNTVGSLSSVYVVEDGKIVEKRVTIGPATPEGVPIISGIEPSAKVVVLRLGLEPGKSVAPYEKRAEKK